MNTNDIQDTVKQKYGAAALRVMDGDAASCCSPAAGSSGCCGATTESWDPITSDLYESGQVAGIPAEALLASLGCGNPTALAQLEPGQVVLDLGSGGGIDVLLSAKRVGPTGKAYGLDMTDEMLALANENKARAGATNVEFLRGEIERIPLPDATVDVIISNCVINLSADKQKVLAEAYRVLKPGGRLAVSDVVVRGNPPEAVRKNMELWIGCVAGALEESHFMSLLTEAGFENPSIEPTRIYKADDAAAFLAGTGLDVETLAREIDGRFMSAFVRATKPANARVGSRLPVQKDCCGPDCCAPSVDIRRARASDQPAVVALLSDAGLSVPGVAEHFDDFLVAERDHVIVGAVGLELRDQDALLRSAVVAPVERGKGIGDDLFHSVVDFARAKGVSALHLLTTTADGYWAKRGFSVVSRDDIPAAVKESAEFKGACPSSAVAMSKGI